MTALADMAQLAPRCAGKSVAVVGNAAWMQEATHGPAIDAADMVLRFNQGFRFCAPETTGVRTDLLALGAAGALGAYDAFLARTMPAAIWTRRLDSKATAKFLGVAGKFREVFHYDQGLRDALHGELGRQRPTTGLLMVHWLLSATNAARIDLYGFDFFATPPIFAHADVPKVFHAPEAERALIERWGIEDPRLRFVSRA
ncbi:MAG: glycosyltransferase family 29 protein [Deltaproteobacteria bacterium]|nr:glycosyltransferase family 29 protein [Deltaproteobacteria bacterium]